MKKKKVSVVIPVYNCPESYLRQCLDSVLGQTLQELELILVDDCSTDGSLGVLEEYAKKDTRIHLIPHEKNAGIAAARNTGAKAVTGEYLYFMDCDDWIDSQTLERVYGKCQEENLDFCVFEGDCFYESAEAEANFPRPNDFYRFKNPPESVVTGQKLFENFATNQDYHGLTLVWLMMIKTSFYQEQKIEFLEISGGKGDDHSVCFKIFLHGQRTLCLKDIFYHYYVRGGSGTTKKRGYDFFHGHYAAYLDMVLELGKANIKPEIIPVFLEYLDSNSRYIVGNYYRITNQEGTMTLESLQNMSRAILNHPLLRYPTWEEFEKILHETEFFCFFGGGQRAQTYLELFQKQGWKKPIAICDNSKKLHGTSLEEIPILSFHEAIEKYPNLRILITNYHYQKEIYQQIIKEIPEERILYFVF